LTLRGTPFIYQGQEIGMTNCDFASMDELDDVESHNVDAMLKGFKIPPALRWWIIRNSARDNARTPMQWDSTEGAGFTSGDSWMRLNSNADWLNYAAEEDDADSVLHYYRQLIAWRGQCETIMRGDFQPLYADRSVMVYRRTPAIGTEGPSYTIALNMSGHARRPQQLPADGTIVMSNTGRRHLSSVKDMVPWEALVIKDA